MKLIHQSHTVIPGMDEINNLPKLIEAAGRTCYKSQDKITEDSANRFCRLLIANHHDAMLEHSVIIFRLSDLAFESLLSLKRKHFKFMNITSVMKRHIVSGNVRAWRDLIIENPKNYVLGNVLNILTEKIPVLFEDIKKPLWKINYNIKLVKSDDLSTNEKISHKTYSVRFITDRGVTHELVRHRTASFAQESTRYVKYHAGDMEFIHPVFQWGHIENYIFIKAMESAEKAYKLLIESKALPQEARTVLPNSLKTEIVVTANIEEWIHIMKLRTAKSAHPQIRALMIPLLQEFKQDTGLFDNIVISDD